MSNCIQLIHQQQETTALKTFGQWGEKGEASFIMHASLRVMSPWYSQSPEFPLTALIKAVVSGTGKEEGRFYQWFN